jgi:uncharacterized protein
MAIDDSHGPALAARGPVRGTERVLAPDLARGAMLLFIALANAPGVVFGGPGIERHPEGVDRALNLLMNTFVHSRAYPVFAVMFGYGLVQLARRQEAAGATQQTVRSLLLRRNLWLIVFGFFHALLLSYGDFLGAYGLIGVVATLALLRRGDRTQRVVLWLWALSALEVLVLAAIAAFRVTHGSNVPASMLMNQVSSLVAPTYAASMRARLVEWPVHTATVLPAIIIVWLGMWAARHRFLEAPSAHQRVLRQIAVGALTLTFLGGLPLGLTSAGILRADSAALSAIFLLHQVSGMFGGPGYIALAGLASHWLSRRPASARLVRMVGLVTALGQRSLSAYLLQSIAWVMLLSPYGLALGRRFSSPTLTAVVVALLVWSVSLVAAGILRRHGYRGPAETLLRRLTYG